eukprot:Clim_evm13s161 gene=Clim_evmTU13s161
MSGKGRQQQKVIVPPINLVFRFLQNKQRVSVWLYEDAGLRIEGVIVGFDEYMNLVMEQATEVHLKGSKGISVGERIDIGRIMLKGDTISLIQPLQLVES